MNVFLDTDIAIEILRARNHAISSKWNSLVVSGALVYYSPIIATEIWGGAFPNEHALIATFFRPLICVSTDYEIGLMAGSLIRKFAKSHGLEVPDALIAATAIQHNSALWTRNRKHYPMPQLTFFA